MVPAFFPAIIAHVLALARIVLSARATAIVAGSWQATLRCVLVLSVGAAMGSILLLPQNAYGRDVHAPFTPAKITPTILRISDAVRPGRSFSINGEDIAANDRLDVAAAPDLSGTSSAVPPASALHPKIIQTDVKGHFLVATMPAAADPGVYNVWVKRDSGWSAPYKMNAARVLFMSECLGHKGTDIEVVGRNFDQSEFGGLTQTQVRLESGDGATYAMPTKDLTPYHVTFTIGNESPGTYFVEVSNDGGVHWSRPSSGQTLTIIRITGTDPLGLNVPWAQDFNWANVIDVTRPPYNIDPNVASGDNTSVLQAANDALEQAGGGVLYLPNGNYYLRNLRLGAGVIIEGEEEYKTKIYYTGDGNGNLIDSKTSDARGGFSQLQGVARLSLLLSNPDVRPDIFLNLGDDGSAQANEMLRHANRIFVTDVNLNYPYSSGTAFPPSRGIGVIPLGKERFLIQNSTFSGWYAMNTLGYVTQYFIVRNNSYTYAIAGVGDHAMYAFVEGNSITVHPPSGLAVSQESHGIFTRGDAYIGYNKINGAGRTSGTAEGETIAWESGGWEGNFNWGTTLSATATSMTVLPHAALVNPMITYGELCVWITEGRGLGQLRKVLSIRGNTITVDTPFAVIPDDTSKWTLVTPNKHNTVYKNMGTDNIVGILPYGIAYDTVIADNVLTDTDGITVWAINQQGIVDMPSYFTRITGNTVTGISRAAHSNHIGLIGARQAPNYFDVMVYGSEIVDNILSGNAAVSPRPEPTTTGGTHPGIFLQSYGGGPSNGRRTGDITNTIVEANQLANLQTGVTLMRCSYGTVVNNNSYDSGVFQFLLNAVRPFGVGDNVLVTANTSQ